MTSAPEAIAKRYQAERHGDWVDVRDVPIFGEVPANARGNPDPIGADWHREAIAWAAARRAEGYLSPLHIGHHDGETHVVRGGFVYPKRVGRMVVEGREQSVIFADFHVPVEIAESLQRLELPFTSVEIPPDWLPRILSVALLDHEPPHFPFPLISVGQFGAAGSHRVHFGGGSMKAPEELETVDGAGDAGAAPTPGVEVPPWASAFADMLLARLMEVLPKGKEAEESEEAEGGESEEASDAERSAAYKAAERKFSAEIADLRGTVSRLRETIAAEGDIRSAEAAIAAHFGGVVSDVHREQVRLYRAQGAQAMAAYVSGLTGAPVSPAPARRPPPKFAAPRVSAVDEATAEADASPEVQMFGAHMRPAARAAYQAWIAGGRRIEWTTFARSRGLVAE